MKAYLDIVENVLENGHKKTPVRIDAEGKAHPVDGGVTTIGLPCQLFEHDMAEGFPLLTTKKMAWKSIRVELEGFIKGITDKKWYQDRKCNIWSEWCNPTLVKKDKTVPLDEEELAKRKNNEYYNVKFVDLTNEERKEQQVKEMDLGPIYGYQWREFDGPYEEMISSPLDPLHDDRCDQLSSIVNTLHTNYNDRRMVCSAWNPNQIHQMALPPCHWGWNVTVYDNKLSLFWVQRSCDLMLGVPFNIASYALLLSLLAEEAGLDRGILSGMLVDCHIYENQIDGAREQITREPKPLPTVNIDHDNWRKRWQQDGSVLPKEKFNIFDWTHEEIEVIGYDSHPRIDFGAVAV